MLIFSAIFTAFCVWAAQAEYYPFSAWQMYSGNEISGRAVYYRLYAHTEQGEKFRTDLRVMTGALSQGRFLDRLDVFSAASNKENINKAGMLLQACAEVYNAEHSGSEKIIKFQLEKWVWDFEKDGNSNASGKKVDVFEYAVV